jgi:hypothetical protein
VSLSLPLLPLLLLLLLLLLLVSLSSCGLPVGALLLGSMAGVAVLLLLRWGCVLA